MTREEISSKIEELKAKKKAAEHNAVLYDLFQIAYKICLNSVYGFTGTKFSPVFNKDIAESVTLTGQNVIKEMVRFANGCLNKIGKESEAKEWVVAGDTDSVLGSSKISVNSKDMKIEDLFDLVKENGMVEVLENGSELAFPYGDTFVTDTLERKALVRNVMKHKVSKKLYKVEVNGNEPLVMTEDHSIMVERDGKIIECKPAEIKDTDFIIVKDE